jgi:hypothetical protein
MEVVSQYLIGLAEGREQLRPVRVAHTRRARLFEATTVAVADGCAGPLTAATLVVGVQPFGATCQLSCQTLPATHTVRCVDYDCEREPAGGPSWPLHCALPPD